MYIERQLAPHIKQSLLEMPIVTITGPRQSGKTTLAQKIAPNFRYVNLENLDERDFATNDPRGRCKHRVTRGRGRGARRCGRGSRNGDVKR